MTREVVLDANVIVAWLDEADVLATRAGEPMPRGNAGNAREILGVSLPSFENEKLRSSSWLCSRTILRCKPARSRAS